MAGVFLVGNAVAVEARSAAVEVCIGIAEAFARHSQQEAQLVARECAVEDLPLSPWQLRNIRADRELLVILVVALSSLLDLPAAV